MRATRLREGRCALDGRVDMDEAYLGGGRSHGKRGRGVENTIPIVAVVRATSSGCPVVAFVRQQSHTAEAVPALAATYLLTSAIVVSDGL